MIKALTMHYLNFFNAIKKKHLFDYPFSKRKILDSSKRREFADDNFEFDENRRTFFKLVENTAGKGEIARYE